MVLAVLSVTAVNFPDQKLCKLKLCKSEKVPKFLMYHFVPLKGCKTVSHVAIVKINIISLN